MFKLFQKNPLSKKNYFLALDIGTEVIKSLICVAEGRQARVLGVGKRHQNLGDMQSGVVTDIASVIEHCQESIREAEQQSGVTPDQLIMGIAGELVKGMTVTTTYVRKEPDAKIDFGELKNIIHKVQWKAFEQARAEIAEESGSNTLDIKLVHSAITDVRIDGYKMTNPIGFQGKEVTVSIFNAFAPLVHFGALQTIAAELELDLIAIAAEPYAVARCLGREDGGDFSGVFIDVGGGTTDIAVVRNGSVEGTRMFTIGGRSFTKRIAHTLNISFQEAEEIKIAHSNGKLEKQSEKIIVDAVESDSEVWLAGIGLALSEFYNIDVFPSHIYLCGGGSLLPEMKKSLESLEWTSKLNFAKKPVVNFLQPKYVTNIIDETKQLRDVQDITPMALANLALELVGEEHLLSKLLKKMVRLISD